MATRQALESCWDRKQVAGSRIALILLLWIASIFVSRPELQAAEPTAKEELRAAQARTSYYLSLLRWKENRPQEAVNILRQVPPSQRAIEWHLTYREFYGGDITCYGHTGKVDCVTFSPDGSLVASGGGDNRVRLWDARTGLELKVWQGLDREPNAGPPHASSVRFSPDGSQLAAGCGYGTDIGFQGVIKIWDIKTGKLLKKLDETRWVTRIEFSRDAKRIAYGTLNHTAALVWDLEADKKLTLKMTEKTTYIHSALSPDGTLVAAGEFGRPRYRKNRTIDNRPCAIKLWDARSGEEVRTLNGHTTAIAGVVFSPDGKQVASADHNAKIKLWDVQTGKALKTFAGNGPVKFTPNGSHLITNAPGRYGNRSLQFVNLKTDQVVALKESEKPEYEIALHPGGTYIAGIAGRRIKLWDVRTGETIKTLKGHVTGYHRMAFSPDGAWLATGSDDQTVRLWDCRGIGNEWSVMADEELAFSPDGKTVATAGDTIQLWNTRDGRKIGELKNHTDRVTRVVFSPNSKLIASASKDKTARVWEAATGKQLAVIRSTSAVTSVAFNSDGTRLVTSDSEDKAVRIWDWRAGKQLANADGDVAFSGFPGRPKAGTDYIHGLTWSPDGKWILSLYDSRQSGPYWNRVPTGHIRIWEAGSGKKAATLKGHKWAVTSVAFSSDSRWIVSGGKDATIRIWDVKTREEVMVIGGHTGAVHDVAFSPDSSRILSTGGDGTVRIWDRTSGAELKTFGKALNSRRSGYGHITMRNRIAVSAAGDEVFAKMGNKINRWSARTTEQVRVLQGLKAPMAISHDGELVASVSGVSINIWDTKTGKKIRTLHGHTTPIRCLAFDRKAARLASAGKGQNVRMWNTKTGEQLAVFETSVKYVSRVAFHPDGTSLLAEGIYDKRAAWDIASGSVTNPKNWPHQALDPPHRSGDQRWLLTSLRSYVRVANLQFTSRKELKTYLQAKTSRSTLWHQQQALIAEQKSNWYAASFHRAWELRIDPTSKSARKAMQLAHKKLLEDPDARAIVPPVVIEVLGELR